MSGADRYREEVAEIDRRRDFRVRAATLVGMAALTVVALWSAGLPPSTWLDRAWQWISAIRANLSHDESQSVATPISKQNLMAPVAASPVVDTLAGTTSSISPTPQRLFLMSTMPGRNAQEGTAALGVDPKNPQTYSAGALLANGVRLAEVYKQYVVLERGRQSVRLYLHDDKTHRGSQESDLLFVGGGADAPTPAATTREVLTDYIRPNPIYDGDVLRGYEVYSGARSAVFAQLGLQAGDVITALDGVPLDNPTTALEMLRQLTQGMAMTATIRRKGKVERIALDGAPIVADQTQPKTAAVGPSGM